MNGLPNDDIYVRLTLHSIPHRMRVQQILSELREVPWGMSYADVGCGSGFITQRIIQQIQPRQAVGYDGNPQLTRSGQSHFSGISFAVWDFARESPPPEKYDLVTCFETLEHVTDLARVLTNLLGITRNLLVVTVPIELGMLGASKFVGKLLLGRQALTPEHSGSALAYLSDLVRGGDITRYRTNPTATEWGQEWSSHTGFDYRKVDEYLQQMKLRYVARNRGWNRFYRISVSGQ
jgi:SAM-dependent methyltransferase